MRCWYAFSWSELAASSSGELYRPSLSLIRLLFGERLDSRSESSLIASFIDLLLTIMMVSDWLDCRYNYVVSGASSVGRRLSFYLLCTETIPLSLRSILKVRILY